ncbi:hypothetical protein L2I57_022255 [Tychonema sp. BBK16]
MASFGRGICQTTASAPGVGFESKVAIDFLAAFSELYRREFPRYNCTQFSGGMKGRGQRRYGVDQIFLL